MVGVISAFAGMTPFLKYNYMSNLKQLRLRIKSVKSTRKITKAMQMISAAKLRKAKIAMEEGHFFHDAVKQGLDNVIFSTEDLTALAKSMIEKMPDDASKLIIAFSSDRGLCGGFNQNIIRMVKSNLLDNPDIKVIAIGKRMMNIINTNYPDNLVSEYSSIEMNDSNIEELADSIISMINDSAISSCDLYFNLFKNALTQVPTQKRIVPFTIDTGAKKTELQGEDILNKLLRMYLIAEIKYAFLQSRASEEASRTTAMDNATRNAGELIDKLTLVMNRQRQANITSELTEIISGAEAI
jgi:F-type H+-transporting ATPase subunit gamma